MIGKDGTLYIDNSTLASVATCDAQATMRHVLHRAAVAEAAPLVMGHAGHEAMAEYLKTGDMDLANSKLITEYHDWAMEHVPADDRLAWENVADVFWAYLNAIDGKLPFRVNHPDDIEIGFAYPLTDDIVFVGRMDGLVTRLEDSTIQVLEHKFTGHVSAQWVKQWKLSSQVTGYLWAAKQHFGKVDGVLINAIEVSQLPSDPKRKCATHKLPYSECRLGHVKHQIIGPVGRTDEQLEAWKQDAIMLATQYRQLLAYNKVEMVQHVGAQGMFSGQCWRCDFADICQFGRRPADIMKATVHNEWTPYTIVEE